MELLSATATEKAAAWKLLQLKKVCREKSTKRMFPEQGIKELPENH